MVKRKDTALDLSPLLGSHGQQDPTEAALAAVVAKDVKRFTEAVSSPDIELDYVFPDTSNLRLIDLTSKLLVNKAYLEALLSSGANPTAVNPATGKSAVHYAAQVGNAEALKLLLDAGANANALDPHNDTPLHLLVIKWEAGNDSFAKCLDMLLEWPDIAVNVSNNDGCTPFYIAAAQGHQGIVTDFWTKCPNLDLDTFRCFEDGRSARDVLSSEYPNMEHKSREWKMEPEKGATDYKYRLNYFLRASQEIKFCQAFRQVLLEGLTDLLTYSDGENLTYLQIASQKGLTKVVKLLLKNNVDVNQAPFDSTRAIFLATKNGHDEVVSLLLAVPGVDLSPDVNGECLLHAAMQSGAKSEGLYESLRHLLNHPGVDPNAKDSKGRTPLRSAVMYADERCIFALLDAGARLDAANNFGESPIDLISIETLNNYLNSKITTNNEHPKGCNFAMVFNYQFAASDKHADHVYGIRTELLRCLSESKELRTVLKHPIYSTVIFLKWQRVRMFFYLNLFFYSLFCFLLTVFVLFGNQIGDCPDLSPNDQGPFYMNTCLSNQAYAFTTKWFILAFLCVLAATEVFQFIGAPLLYIKTLQNWLQVAVVVASFTAVTSGCVTDPENSTLFCPTVTAFAILFTWFEFFFVVGSHPKLTIFIDMFRTASMYLFQLLAVHTSLILAFALSFHILFRGVESPFSTVEESIFKVLVMFTAFLFLVAIVLINLMVGLAVSATRPLEDDAFLFTNIAQVPIISYFESVFFNESYAHKAIWKIFKCMRPNMNKGKHPILFMFPNQSNRAEIRFVPKELKKPETAPPKHCQVIRRHLSNKIVEDAWTVVNNKADGVASICKFSELKKQMVGVQNTLEDEIQTVKTGLIEILQKLEDFDTGGEGDSVECRRKKSRMEALLRNLKGYRKSTRSRSREYSRHS